MVAHMKGVCLGGCGVVGVVLFRDISISLSFSLLLGLFLFYFIWMSLLPKWCGDR